MDKFVGWYWIIITTINHPEYPHLLERVRPFSSFFIYKQLMNSTSMTILGSVLVCLRRTGFHVYKRLTIA